MMSVPSFGAVSIGCHSLISHSPSYPDIPVLPAWLRQRQFCWRGRHRLPVGRVHIRFFIVRTRIVFPVYDPHPVPARTPLLAIPRDSPRSINARLFLKPILFHTHTNDLRP